MTAPELELFCPHCNYSLRGLSSANCPECGHDVNQYRTGESKIAWLRVRGWLHPLAFWQTVFQITFRDPKALRFDLFREVDYRHTRAFTWLAALHAWAAIVILLAVWPIAPPNNQMGFSFFVAADPVMQLLAVFTALSLLVGLCMAAGVHTYFFHPRSLPVALQKRAIALSYLSAAPMALLPLFALLAAISVFLTPEKFDIVRVLLPPSLAVFWLILWYRRVTSFNEVLIRDAARGWFLALTWPVVSLLTLLGVGVFLPAVGFYVLVILESLK